MPSDLPPPAEPGRPTPPAPAAGSPPAEPGDEAPEPGGRPSAAALDGLVPLVYGELRAIAHRHLAARRGGPAARGTIATTALVHEAYLKLAGHAGAAGGVWVDRAHFLAVAAIAMRQILVDRARARATRKRGGGQAHVTLEEEALGQDALAADDAPEALLALDDALERLTAVAPRLGRVVEMRFYGGMSEEEIATALGVTTRTVQRDWAKARMLLRRALDEA